MSKFRGLLAVALALAGLGTFVAGAGAALPIKFGGNPLTVYVDEVGRCQSSYANAGGDFFPGDFESLEEGGLADCGFFIATPNKPASGIAEQPADLQGPEVEGVKAGRVFGFEGDAGPRGFGPPSETTSPRIAYTPVSNTGPTGDGSAAAPFTVVTIYDAYVGLEKYFEVTQTTEYVSGNPYFTVNYDVKNTSAKTVYYRAIYAGDLYVNGSDTGTGAFLAGPPRFVGGQNQTSGVFGGFQEDLQTFDGSPTPAWSSYGEDYWATLENGGIWHDVENSANATAAFPDTISSEDFDDGAGVAWDTNYTAGHGLAPGAEQKYAIVNYTSIPSTLLVTPTSQSLTQGATATVNVTAINNAGQPYPNTPLRYTIAGANPRSGAVTTNAQGAAQIQYAGSNVGLDVISMYLDLGNTGAQAPADPTGTAQVTFVAPPSTPPPAPSGAFIPVGNPQFNPTTGQIVVIAQFPAPGTATSTGVVQQGATLARAQEDALIKEALAEAAKHKKSKKCKRGFVKKGKKCLNNAPVVFGTTAQTISAAGTYSIVINPSSKVLKALKAGKKLNVVVSTTFQNRAGGAPVTHLQSVFVKLKPKKPAKHGHKKH